MDFVLDASAMIAYLRNEPGAERVQQALLDSSQRCFAHALNLCEVFYDFHRAADQETALNALTDLRKAGVIENSDIDPQFWQTAGMLKANHRRISLADCFALTLSGRLGATILTADHHEFDPLVERGIAQIQFIR